MRKPRKIPVFHIVTIAVIAFSVAVNIIARLSTPFADFYVEKIFPIISTPFVWLVGWLPFSLGELLIALAVVLVVFGLPALIAVLIAKRKNKPFVKKALKIAGRLVSFCIAYVCLTTTLNCFVMYQCSTFSSKYFDETKHSEEALLATIQAVSERIGELAPKFERDEQGYIVYSGDYISDCKEAMQNVAKSYSQLSGYYPNPKPIASSYFMSQQGTIGLYMPFAFEATYNTDTQPISKPCTICHELAHLKGIIQEDEASFVSMVACFNSSNDFVRYSGYLDAFYYLYSNAQELIGTKYEQALINATSAIPQQYINLDLYSFKAGYFEENKDKEIIPTETVEAISNAVTDATLKLNDVYDGIKSYYRVTELLMDYYQSGGNI